MSTRQPQPDAEPSTEQTRLHATTEPETGSSASMEARPRPETDSPSASAGAPATFSSRRTTRLENLVDDRNAAVSVTRDES